jgi:hypothetical protein
MRTRREKRAIGEEIEERRRKGSGNHGVGGGRESEPSEESGRALPRLFCNSISWHFLARRGRAESPRGPRSCIGGLGPSRAPDPMLADLGRAPRSYRGRVAFLGCLEPRRLNPRPAMQSRAPRNQRT